MADFDTTSKEYKEVLRLLALLNSSVDFIVLGRYGRLKIQRYRCTSCSTTFSDPKPVSSLWHDAN
jgi:hypothetical protein